jgi:metal-dependent hydrolase (beta-lactamase superfamily II)
MLFVACGHQGVSLALSIVECAQVLFEAPIYGLIGGLHLLARGGLRSTPMVAVGGDRVTECTGR